MTGQPRRGQVEPAAAVQPPVERPSSIELEGKPRRTRPQVTASEQRKLQHRLDTIAELHRRGVSGWCPTCLLEHPCRTFLLATGAAE